MEEEEYDKLMEIYRRATTIANNYGPIIADEADEQANIAVTAAAMMLVVFAKNLEMSMHECISFVMSVYKRIDAQEEGSHEIDK